VAGDGGFDAAEREMLTYIYAGAAVAFVALAGYAKWTHDRLAFHKGRGEVLEATLTQERKARDHERKLSEDASRDYENRLKALADARVALPTRPVRLCVSPTGWVPAPSHAAIGTPAGVTREQPAEARRDIEAGPDIGGDLYALADQADERAAQCNALIKFVRSR
jgi:hypothetical protein